MCQQDYFIRRKTSRNSLNKPKYTLPNWLFPPGWIITYCTMGYSSYLVWRDGGSFEEVAVPFGVYGLNLILNWSWTPLFFEVRKIKWSLYHIVALWVSTAALGIVFYSINPTAGYLIIPNVVWNSYIVVYSYGIYRDNKQLLAVEKAEEKKILEKFLQNLKI
ncbi:translocator protein isoform X2 [Monomorium pharaonis]|uniref:translocator protein isoform X2 n=1 Tax=Monomorium pharaonis TaxID=307658 RepID=UPI00063F56DF|nr:translocator protein isoform X2 [Monomorium pharaonis]